MDAKVLVKRTLFVLVLFGVSLGVKHVLLNGLYVRNLAPAPALAGSIAPSVVTSPSKTLPVPGKDFKILSAQYFDDKQWAVVVVAKLPDMNSATLVLKKINGVYTAVLGPGTSFSSSVTQSMPPDVAAYLAGKGLI